MGYVRGKENEKDIGLDGVHNPETLSGKKLLFSLQEDCSRKQRDEGWEKKS